MGRLDAPRRLQLMTERAKVISARGGPDVGRYVDAAAAIHPRQARGTVPVHGDLHVWQLLIDDDGRPTGVLDWGDTHVGDPALDLSIALCYLPPGARDAFRRAYGPIDAATWALARFRAIFIAITLLDYGQDVGDEMLVRESIRELELRDRVSRGSGRVSDSRAPARIPPCPTSHADVDCRRERARTPDPTALRRCAQRRAVRGGGGAPVPRHDAGPAAPGAGRRSCGPSSRSRAIARSSATTTRRIRSGAAGRTR